MIKLTKKQAVLYKQRWRQIGRMQTQELKTTPMSLKFKQLCVLMNSFPAPPNTQREKEVSAVRSRWIALKKKMMKI